jgi:hypothetical protein
VALVDDEDFERVSKYKWSVNIKRGKKYAQAHVEGETIELHRLIMRLTRGDGKEVDHINVDGGLDCRKINLRLATRSQNAANRPKNRGTYSSIYKGVYEKTRTRWIAHIKVMGKTIWLGSYKTEEEAARAYDRAAIKYFGEFAYTNFPKEDYVS